MQRCVLAPIARTRRRRAGEAVNCDSDLREKPLNIQIRQTRKENIRSKSRCARAPPPAQGAVFWTIREEESEPTLQPGLRCLRRGFRGIRGCGQGLCHWNASEAAEANGGCFLRL